MKYPAILLCILSVAFANFDRTSGLIDIPKATILPHLGFRVGLNGSIALGSGINNDAAEENFHTAFGLGNQFEGYLDIYSFNILTIAIGFCHNFYQDEKIALAWGIHDISHTLDISELGHGDSVGWYDDMSYSSGEYEKPFEFGSAFLVSTYFINEFMDVTIGIGRGRYVGYGTHSRYFNTNLHVDHGGDWAIGLIGGLNLKLAKGVSCIIEGDGRDLNVGFVYRFLPVEFSIAVSKLENSIWRGENLYQPRLSTSLSYVKIREEPRPGIIAGTVFDEKGNSVIAEVSLLHTDIPKLMTDVSLGTFTFSNVKPGVYEIYASAAGYEGQRRKTKVISGATVFCDFTLAKEAPKTGDVIGTVIDFKTKEPLVVRLTTVEADRTTKSDANGIFVFKGLAPSFYRIKTEAIGYETGFHTAVVKAGEKSEIEIKLVKRGMVVTLEGINFDFNKAIIKPEFYPTLDEAAAILTNHPEISVEIQGHTDAIGNNAYNLKLSNDRAKSVCNYLIVRHMIEPTRLIARGYGENAPIADNHTEEGRQRNRRVDFVILK